jgi:hypothetical protein
MQSLLAWAWAPVVLFSVCFGLGLLVEAFTRQRVQPALLAPVGFAFGLLAAPAAYRLALPAWITAVLLLILASGGVIAQRRTIRDRTGIVWPLIAGLAAYALCLAPAVLSGSWTWSGYNFTNDPANTLTATAWILGHGFHEPAAKTSTNAIVAAGGIEQGYPLGPHLFMGTLREFVGVPLVAMYQTFIAFAAALAAFAITVLSRRGGMSGVFAAVSGALATGATLFYNYGQLGGLKEVVCVALLATAAAVAAERPTPEWNAGTVVMVTVPLAALVPALSAGGVVYGALFAVVILVVGCSNHPRWPAVRVVRFAAVGIGALVLLNAPSLADAVRFGSNVTSNLDTSPLGQLLRPLPLGQIGGIWWSEDWRLPVPHGVRWTANAVLLVVVFGFATAGVAWALARRRPLVVSGVFVIAAAYLVIAPQATPYGDSKLLVMISPFVLATAALGIWALGRRWPLLALISGSAVAAGVLYSDAITYREVRLAPVDRMEALEDVARASRGHGLVLQVEWEEWAKFFYRDAAVNSPFEVYLGPKPALLRKNIVELGRRYDLDELKLSYVTSFPAIVTRRAPDGSRPPANYRLEHRNRFYDLWLRDEAIRVRYHLPIQGLFTSQVKVSCRAVTRFARLATPGDRLVAAVRPMNIVMQPAVSVHSPGWTQSPAIKGTIVPTVPGQAHARMSVPGGRYGVWLYGSSGRPISARIDGREVGTLEEVNSPGNWLQVATVDLRRGKHELGIERGGGSLAPGSAYQGRIGPLALVPTSPTRLASVAPREASKLCEQPVDWLEIVRSAKAPPNGDGAGSVRGQPASPP